ncbi:hypothetical protein Cfor_05120, partial [Coptotermes formosanus]
DKYKRALADGENMRRRLMKQIEDAKHFGIQGFCKDLLEVFTRHGLIPVNPLEEKFDPNLHEALFQQEVQGKAPGTIVVVSKIGYKLHERVIRPALVGVAKGP